MDKSDTKGKDAEETKKAEFVEQTVGPRIVNVSASRNFSFFVFQAKKFFKVAVEKPVVELHSIGSAIPIAVQTADTLVKHGYATMAEIRTDQVEVDRQSGEKLTRAKLFITLNKSKGFDAAWEEFEKSKEEREKNAEGQEHHGHHGHRKHYDDHEE